jgi:hypothetical protein
VGAAMVPSVAVTAIPRNNRAGNWGMGPRSPLFPFRYRGLWPGAAGAESILVQGPWYRSAVAFASSGAPGAPHAFEESRMVVMAADQMHIPLSYGPEWL